MSWKKNKYILFFIILCVCVVGVSIGYHQLKPDQGKVSIVEVLEVETGKYGYKIIQGERTVIMQPFVPGISGKRFFACPEDARKVGELVCKRMLAGIELSVTPGDLEQLGIISFIE